jgi:hypothetical protein
MKMAVLTFSMILLLSLLGNAHAAESNKRQVAGTKQVKVEKKSRMDDLRSRLQGFNGRMRI